MSRIHRLLNGCRHILPILRRAVTCCGKGLSYLPRPRLPRLRLAAFKRLIPSRPVLAGGVVIATLAYGHVKLEPRPLGADVAQLAESSANRPDAPPLPENSAMRIEGQVATLVQIAMLQEAVRRLESIESYTTVFEKHERINGVLLERHSMSLKVRHSPFSVYMKVLSGDNTDRQILYPAAPDGDRKNMVLVKLATLGGRLPAIALETDDPKVMEESRYPITKAGILELSRMALQFRQKDLTFGDRVRTTMRDDETFAGRPVYTFSVEYSRPEDSADYRKCVLQIDRELMLPVSATNWTWPDKVKVADGESIEQATLLEYYSFRDVRMNPGLKATDFIATSYGM